MRQGSNGRRPRGRPQRKQHGGTPRHGNFDSSGPEGRIRGNAHQVYEKYIGLARDATSAGDRIAAETYYQYAEHYYRIVNARTDPKPNGEGQSARGGGNGHAEVGAEAAPKVADEQPESAPKVADEQPEPAPFNSEPAPETSPAQDRPAPQRRRRPRQAKAAEPKPDSKPVPEPDVQPEAPPSKDGEPAES